MSFIMSDQENTSNAQARTSKRSQVSIIVGVLIFLGLGFKIYRIVDEASDGALREAIMPLTELEWRAFETASFSASFPGTPDEKPNEASGITLYQVIVDRPNGGLFLVGVQTLPPGVEAPYEEIHDIISKEIISALNGTATPLRPISLGEFKGSEFDLKADIGDITIRLYSAGSLVYRVAYGGKSGSKHNSTNRSKFFNSFHIKAQP
jgi:hypothetical protein